MIDFNKLIDSYLFRKYRPKKIGRYYPSECGSCLRKVWYSYKYPQKLKPDLMKIFEMGNILHDFVVEVLKSKKTPEVELLRWEFPVKLEMENFKVSGRVDDLILIKASGKTYLVEVKSCRFLFDRPQNHHLMQLQLYMHATGIHNGILLYIEKSNLQSKVFDVKFDVNVVKEALSRFNELHNCLITDNVPVAEARIKKDIGWMCKLCEYRERCFKETPRISR